ncbi:unnamed protein product [Tilletia controversa]|nr:hypothetical protein CF336_g6695 [Tilletia laevis]CAD6902744.1 unnamed protein product [Tilletia controversa]CAD6913615.1 unnamed protein product [Tilletia controversa]CAD6940927.1 unnamed protein product [Tilletia controversa]CAD6945463.1 unnamed protein product [Tilletia caries]
MSAMPYSPDPLPTSAASTSPASTPSATTTRRPPPLQSATSSEYYGFALFTLTTCLWLSWIVWALVPQEVLEWWGVLWMPSREWAYLLPAWSMATMLFGYAAYNAINIMNTAGPHELHSLVDEHSEVGIAGRDMPFGVVSRRLYLLPDDVPNPTNVSNQQPSSSNPRSQR